MAVVWGFLADIAIVAQLSGLHAVMLVALAAPLLRIPQCNAECAKLGECARRLRALVGMDMAARHPAVAGLVAAALAESAGLVDSYRGSTLWCRVRTGRGMETRLRDMQSRVNCLCALVLCVHANLLTLTPPPDGSASETSNPTHGADASHSQGGSDHEPDNNEPEGDLALSVRHVDV